MLGWAYPVRMISRLRRGFDADGIGRVGQLGQPPTDDLIEVEVAEHSVQLPEARAVSFLRPWLQGWQIIVGAAFQSFLVGSAWIAATVRDDDTHREDRQGTAERLVK
jgi:hypothetical protein